jgi:hypothetical protein
MNEQKGVWSGIKSISNFQWAFLVDVVIDDLDDLPTELIEVENGRVGVKTYGMELVAVLILS